MLSQKRGQNLSLLELQVPDINTLCTDWVQYRRQPRLQEIDDLESWVCLLCCFKPIYFYERYFGDYLSPLFFNLKLDSRAGYFCRLRLFYSSISTYS